SRYRGRELDPEVSRRTFSAVHRGRTRPLLGTDVWGGLGIRDWLRHQPWHQCPRWSTLLRDQAIRLIWRIQIQSRIFRFRRNCRPSHPLPGSALCGWIFAAVLIFPRFLYQADLETLMVANYRDVRA